MDWFLSQFTNKNGNLIVYRALNNPEGFKLKQAQSPKDDFVSGSLLRENLFEVSVPTRKIPPGENVEAVLRAERDKLTPLTLQDRFEMQEMGAMFDQAKQKEREEYQKKVDEAVERIPIPQTIYRFEVPLKRYKDNTVGII